MVLDLEYYPIIVRQAAYHSEIQGQVSHNSGIGLNQAEELGQPPEGLPFCPCRLDNGSGGSQGRLGLPLNRRQVRG